MLFNPLVCTCPEKMLCPMLPWAWFVPSHRERKVVLAVGTLPPPLLLQHGAMLSPASHVADDCSHCSSY